MQRHCNYFFRLQAVDLYAPHKRRFAEIPKSLSLFQFHPPREKIFGTLP